MDASLLLTDPTLLRSYGAEPGRHAHDHAQLLFGLEGTLELEVAGRCACVDITCGLVIPPGAEHVYQADRPAQVLVLDCPPGPGLERLRRLALPPDWRHQPLHREALLALLGTARTSAPRRRLPVQVLLERIRAEPARPWTAAELADICHLSPQRLRARFAEALGLSPQAFVRQVRLDLAARLLAQGQTLETVALHVGYAGASALSAALRRERSTGARDLRRTGRALRTI